jgi:uncharacterized protein YceK
MKKTLLTITALILLSGSASVFSQDKPKPKKDTVNMDTNAKPTMYYAVEDEKPAGKGLSTATIAIIAGAVVVIAGAGIFFVMKNKKK